MAVRDDRLEGELVGFTFRSEEGGFAVARVCDAHHAQWTVVGPLAHVVEGQHVSLEGRWVNHPQFGPQFQVRSVLVEDPRTRRGIERYLASGAVRGLGPTFARRVVDHFGLETLRIISETPERLTEVPGIGRKRMEEIVRHWKNDQAHREVFATLRGHGIGQALANRIVERYGDDAMAMVARHPYQLATEVRGVGFRTADAIAQAHGIAPDAPERAEAALVHLLREAEGEGHCFLPEEELLARAVGLEIPDQPAAEALDHLCLQGRVVRHPALVPGRAPIYLPSLERAEATVARGLRELARAPAEPEPADLSLVEHALGLTLNEGQRRAVRTALSRRLTVITGGPGTGKTTIVRVLCEAASGRRQSWRLAAPTGRAARRLAESTGRDARTIHRLLEFNARTWRFTRNAGLPIEADAVLIDEASMVDVRLMAALVDALPLGCRLVLVGDADQLPSVGPGQVLADVIGSGVVPVVTLTEVYRQARDSGIVRNAWRIHGGQPPVSAEADPEAVPGRRDFFVVPRHEALPAQATVLQVVQERLPALGFDPLADVQVLTPMHAGPLGTRVLNQALQAALNPTGPAFRRGETVLRKGDRVIQVKNDYDADVFNGDVGRVVEAAPNGVVVDFDGHEVAVTGEKLDNLELAYAISIHKSQGSEYPAVVVVLHRSHRIMLRRNLLYTAVTRARRFCCLVGSPWAIEVAVRESSDARRWTRLGERLAEG